MNMYNIKINIYTQIYHTFCEKKEDIIACYTIFIQQALDTHHVAQIQSANRAVSQSSHTG